MKKYLWIAVLFFPLFGEALKDNNITSASHTYSVTSYLKLLLTTDLEYRDRTLESKVLALESLIEQSRYNPDIYLEGTVMADNNLDVEKTRQSTELEAVGKVHFNMRLYDAQRFYYTSQREQLFKALSDQELIDATERLQLMGIQIYAELMQIQQTIAQYNALLIYQKRITKLAITRSEKGLGGIYDRTQAQNDMLNIRLRLTELKELLIQKEYLFRQSIDSDSTGVIELQAIQYKTLTDSLKELQYSALSSNAHLNFIQKQYELSRSDVETEKARDGLALDWRSHVGYGYIEELDKPRRSDDDIVWFAGLSLKYPLYERNNIALNVEQKKVQALQAKNSVNIEKRTLNRTVNRLYNSLRKYQIKDELYRQQKEVLTERTTTTYNRYKEALETYKPYSDSLRDMAQSDELSIRNAILVDVTTLQLYIVTGRYLLEQD
ncbi:MAG: hypothetical protein DRG24_04725 [Epsilonproteobacteria bacterium]|nr:MAG: hypothetical protein DRG24_04725 [Campylobacterota bacterium]